MKPAIACILLLASGLLGYGLGVSDGMNMYEVEYTYVPDECLR